MSSSIELQPRVSVILILNKKLAIVEREAENKDGSIDHWIDLCGGKPEKLPNGEMQTYIQAGVMEAQQELSLKIECYETNLEPMRHPKPTQTSKTVVFVRGICPEDTKEEDLKNAEKKDHLDARWEDPEAIVPILLNDKRITPEVADYIYEECSRPDLMSKKIMKF